MILVPLFGARKTIKFETVSSGREFFDNYNSTVLKLPTEVIINLQI